MKTIRFGSKIASIRILLLPLLLLYLIPAKAETNVISYGIEKGIFHPQYSQNGMVVSANALASQVGLQVLLEGGNAIDAAVAVGYVLAVTYPQAGNLGGGGFMLIRSHDGSITAIDFREMAPAKASRDMFLNKQGHIEHSKALLSHQAIAIPGTVAGLSYALQHYGSKPLNELLIPAISLAEQGFIVDQALADALSIYGNEVLKKHPTSQKIFFHDNGEAYQAGERLYQADLAKSLKLIAKEGPQAFYHGAIAQQIVDEMQQHNGLISLDDLAKYIVKERQPVSGSYKGYQIYSMPPPSSGGVHVIQILNILENFSLLDLGHNTAASIHLMAEAMKYAYTDRSLYLADPDFYSIPVSQLIDKNYAKQLASKINPQSARSSQKIQPGKLAVNEGEQTTHYSIVDKQGNAVAVTYTLNTNFGTGIIAGNTGIILNNQMDDFSSKPGVANIYGLISGEANRIEPYKRPLSSMSPTIVTKNGKLFLVTGSPGGSRIISTVVQILLNTLEYKMNIAEASSMPRIHHQWLPDELRIEREINLDSIQLLEKRGHHIVVKPTMGSTQSIMVTDEGLWGSADPRSKGDLAIGY